MMSDLETIELRLDESNELLFKVTIQGSSAAPAKVRLVCESDSSDLAYMFEGHSVESGDEIRFVIPEMDKVLKEGETYRGKVEVMVENRYFTPVEFAMVFKQSMKVMAEGIKVNPKAKAVETIKVNAVIKQAPKPVVVQESKPRPVVTAPPKKLSERKKTATGIEESVMEDVARSTIKKLLQGK